MINIYCDESCHLENDKKNVMGIAGISCPNTIKEGVYRDIKKIKHDFNIREDIEIKWNKVSSSKIDYYKALIEYFFTNEFLNFRGVILPDKKILDHKKHNQTHDDFYYKMYYYVISYFLNFSDDINVYIDIKDTCSNHKVNKLKSILDHKAREKDKNINRIQQIRSHENSILQIADLILGAVTYENRQLQTSDAKLELCRLIKNYSNSNLTSTSYLRNDKFNLLVLDKLQGVTP